MTESTRSQPLWPLLATLVWSSLAFSAWHWWWAVVERWIQTDTGLLVSRERSASELELFRKGALPRKRRLLKKDEPIPVLE